MKEGIGVDDREEKDRKAAVSQQKNAFMAPMVLDLSIFTPNLFFCFVFFAADVTESQVTDRQYTIYTVDRYGCVSLYE